MRWLGEGYMSEGYIGEGYMDERYISERYMGERYMGWWKNADEPRVCAAFVKAGIDGIWAGISE